MNALAAWIAGCAVVIAMAAVPVLIRMPSDLGAEQATADDLADALRAARVERVGRTTPVSFSEPRP